MLEWRDIELRAVADGNPKLVLKKCSGSALAGDILGLVGPSGKLVPQLLENKDFMLSRLARP
jgi:hypothetical protein